MSARSVTARSGAWRAGAASSVMLAAGLVAAGVAAQPAEAQSRFTQGGSLFGGRGRAEIAPPVARYVAADERTFVLDRSGDLPLLKFEDSAEVWVLRPAPGPRGDVIYKDELGRQVVRASRMGGLTVFTADQPAGLPAALAGQASSLMPSAISPATLWRHLAGQSRRVFQGTRRKLVFETVEDATPGTSTLLADAATVAAEALTRFRSRKGANGRVAQLKTVRFSTGVRPGAAISRDALEITIAPNQGLAGRPSSERILRTMAAAD
jgi:hypothetical protein